MLKLVNNKRKARRFLDKLLAANKGKGDPIEVAKQRTSAAAALLDIVHVEQRGREIVARRFAKSSSRRTEGTRALLKLSDDELDQFGPKAIIGYCIHRPTLSEQLLSLISNHPNNFSFFQETISTLMNDGTEGPAAMLYLATTNTWAFFKQIPSHVIFSFCRRITSEEKVLSPNWYCAVQLLCLLLRHVAQTPRKSPAAELKMLLRRRQSNQPPSPPPRPTDASVLCPILKSLIHIVTEERRETVRLMPEYEFVLRGLPVLPILAGCCERIERSPELEALTSSTPLKSFLELLINFVFPQYPGPRRLCTEGGLGVYTLISLLKIPSIANLFRDMELSRLASFLVDMVLSPWTLDFQSASEFEKDILRSLTANEELYLTCLGSLPGSTFSIALSGALKEGRARLDSSTANPYEPLGLVERLLSLSNAKVMKEQICHALSNGGACEFLARALHHTGVLSSDDRGLWRAKGLAMTCLGNIIERMNEEQFSSCIKEEMIALVVTIKEDGKVPLVQKGQAIFLLQRYTLAADRFGVRPFHREDTSNTAEEFQNVDLDNATLPRSAPPEGSHSSVLPPLPPRRLGLVLQRLYSSNMAEKSQNVHHNKAALSPSAPDAGSESSALLRPWPLPLRCPTLDIQCLSSSNVAERPQDIHPDKAALPPSAPPAGSDFSALPPPKPPQPRRLGSDLRLLSISNVARKPQNVDPDDMSSHCSPCASSGLPVPRPFSPRPPPSPFIPLDVLAFL
ncbi:hypothetical protein FRC01_013381 [Tulasnella sp. 417]|nr:hypothetical protein FRC01_013381 [Tulasnella sp. 417]